MVLGFAFNPSLTEVLLIRKTKPDWQAGRLNGLGGKIEPNERMNEAMAREFEQECGIHTGAVEWQYFHTMRGPNWEVHSFCMVIDDLSAAEKMEEERPVIVRVDELPSWALLDNVHWLVLLAINFLKPEGQKPYHTTTSYA